MVSRYFMIALLVLLPNTGIASTDCPRGDLDKKYCDRNGDLVADLPTAPTGLRDPKELVFSYTPGQDPELNTKVWSGFTNHLAKTTGKKVKFSHFKSSQVQAEAMRAGRLQVTSVNTGANPTMVNCAGYVPFAMMSGKDGSYGYEMEIIVHRDSGIIGVEALRGKTIAFSAQTSNSGYKAPRSILKDEFGLESGQDYQAIFSGSHEQSIAGVLDWKYTAAAVASSVIKRMVDRKVVSRETIRTLFTSQTFPTTSFGHAHNLHPQLAAKIRQAFFTFDWTASELAKEFVNEAKFMPISYKKHWRVIRQIDAASGVVPACK